MTEQTVFVLRVVKGPELDNSTLCVYSMLSDADDIEDCSRLFFTLDFLNEPPEDWSTDFVSCACSFLHPGPVAGVLVRYEPLGRVWRLTGAVDHRFDNDGWEGVWPD